MHDNSGAQPTTVAIVASRWHADIVDRAVQSFRREIETTTSYAVEIIEVPGAFEIPLRVQRLARSGEYAAIAACAFVIDGGIYRHEFVATTVVDALMRIQLAEDCPVHSAILTPHHFHDHEEHALFYRTHFAIKGRELAEAVLDGEISLIPAS